MNRNEHELDLFLRRKLDEDTPEFKEEYWNKMVELLEKDEDKKKGSPWFKRGVIFLALTALVGLGTYLYSTINKQPSEKNQYQTSHTENKAPEQENLLPLSDTLKYKQPAYTQSTKNIEESMGLENHAEANSIHNQVTQINKENPPNATQAASEHNEEVKPAKAYRKHTSIQDDKIQAIGKIESEKTIGEIEVVNQNLPSKVPIQSRHNKNKSKKEGNKLPTVQESNEQTTNTILAKDLPLKTQYPNQTQTINYHGTLMTQTNRETIIPDYNENPSKYNPRYIKGLENYQTERIDSIVVITYEPIEQKQQSKDKKDIQPEKSNTGTFDKKWALNFLLGINGNFGMKGAPENNTITTSSTAFNLENQTKRKSFGLSPLVGIGLDYQLSKSMWLHTNLGFSYFNALNTNKLGYDIRYSFGVDTNIINVEHKSLFQISLPIGVKYRMMNKHFVLANIGAVMSLDAQSTVKHNTSKRNEMGYRTGFNLFDFIFQVGYEYSLNQRFALYGWYQRGFMDLTKNEYFNNNSMDIQQRVHIGIKYNFINKRQ